MSFALLLPELIFLPDCDHDGLIIHSSKSLHSLTFIYLVPFRKSYYFLSFFTINHFERVVVTFLPNAGHLIWNETPHCLSTSTGLSFLFFTLLFIFSSSSSSPSIQGPGAALSACQTAMSVRAESACHSLSWSVGLPLSLNSVEVNISRRGCMEKTFPF